MMTANEPALRFDRISVEFTSRAGQKVLAVSDFDLSIAKAQFVALVGPSGCGKSTVLRLAAGLNTPNLGRVTVAGAEGKRGFESVAMVFQAPNLLPWKSVLDNVLYPVRIVAPDRLAELRDEAMRLLEMVGLAAFAKSYPDELSGGMQQRVAICRALVLQPQVLLMDEPFSALDALTREELQFELRRIQEATGKTVLFVTHSISESVLLADRVVIMAPRPGRKKDDFTVSFEGARTPKTLSTPEFLTFSDRIRTGIYA